MIRRKFQQFGSCKRFIQSIQTSNSISNTYAFKWTEDISLQYISQPDSSTLQWEIRNIILIWNQSHTPISIPCIPCIHLSIFYVMCVSRCWQRYIVIRLRQAKPNAQGAYLGKQNEFHQFHFTCFIWMKWLYSENNVVAQIVIRGCVIILFGRKKD